jgi:hypothetical protein
MKKVQQWSNGNTRLSSRITSINPSSKTVYPSGKKWTCTPTSAKLDEYIHDLFYPQIGFYHAATELWRQAKPDCAHQIRGLRKRFEQTD